MIETVVEFILLLVAHAAAGIFSSTLKYSKKITYIVWGAWVTLQTALLFFTEFVLTNWTLQFFVGFVLSLLGQYVIFFLTTKGKLAQRIFTMLTYSIFFCIAMSLFTMVRGTFEELHWTLTILVQAVLLFAIVVYFLCYVCPLCRTASKNIATGWIPLIFVNIVFIITIILSSVFPVRLTSFSDSSFITFIFLSISIMTVYPVFFSNIKNMIEAAVKREATETQNKLLLAQIETEAVQMEADSQARHDRRHHNLIMLEFANNNDINSVREYLGSLVERDTQAVGEIRYCENLTVNTVLTVYERRARENGIAVNIKASVSRELGISPQDLVIVIANIFENAVNAVTKLDNREKTIDIAIKENAQRLIVIASNPCPEKMEFNESCYGVGINSIIATANKYEGMCDFSAGDGFFFAKVNLNL